MQKINEVIEFSIGNDSHFLGSDFFPMPNGDHYYLDHENMDSPLFLEMEKFQLLLRHINNNDIEIGKCFANSRKVQMIGEAIGIEIEYWSGWLFTNPIPTFHAWNVIRADQNRDYILDVSLHKARFETTKQFVQQLNEKKISYGDEQRRELAGILKHIKNDISMETVVFGKPIKDTFYFGGSDEYEKSVKRFEALMKAFRKKGHPSFHVKDFDRGGVSKLQLMMNEGK